MTWLSIMTWGTLAINFSLIVFNSRTTAKLKKASRELASPTIGTIGDLIARTAERADAAAASPSPVGQNLESTFGLRCWQWNVTREHLVSPHQGTIWDGSELRCEEWCQDDVVRGVAGIHALLAPSDWQKSWPREFDSNQAKLQAGNEITVPVCGIVERFGKYVLGEDGWRAEWVIIRKLKAPTRDIGLQLERAFPDVEIIYE